MATRIVLSGSTNGRPIVISAATSGAAQTVHTAGSSDPDQVWLWASNDTSSTVMVSVEWGVAAGVIEQDIPANSTELVVDGLRISNSETVQVFCSSSSAINIIGHVNRLS